MLTVRLFRPFPVAQFLAALPPTSGPIAVLDRTKEPGAVGEPLYLDVVAALAEAMDDDAPPFAAMPRVIGGRYGLSSKEFTPAMVKAVFDELADAAPEAPLHRRHLRRRHAPEPPDRRDFRPPRPAGEVQAVFFGLGSDGTVGANKASVKIIGEQHRPVRAGLLRLRLEEVRLGHGLAPALRAASRSARPTSIEDADFVACHQFGLLDRTDVLDARAAGGDVPAQRPVRGPTQVWDHLPDRRAAPDRRQGRSTCGSSTPPRSRRRPGMGSRINTVMQPCFFQLAGSCRRPRPSSASRASSRRPTASAATPSCARNFAAIDRALGAPVAR